MLKGFSFQKKVGFLRGKKNRDGSQFSLINHIFFSLSIGFYQMSVETFHFVFLPKLPSCSFIFCGISLLYFIAPHPVFTLCRGEKY